MKSSVIFRAIGLAIAGAMMGVGSVSAASEVPEVKHEKFVLANGLQVILHVDRKLPIVHVNQWYHVGSKNEKPGRTGFAHLFEHMMFQGSVNASGEYFVYAEKAGANLREGGVNGTTNNDRTNYFATVPSANLENVLWFESDRLATLAEALTIEKLDNQRDVVKNERRQGLENTPYGRWFKLLAENLYPGGHPYSWPVIGSHEDLTAASLDDVKEFFKTYYTPNNLSLVIAGDFDPVEARRLVEKYFGGLPPGPALDRPSRLNVTLDGPRVVEVSDRVPQERVYLGFPAPEYFAGPDAALDLAASVLTDGLSSRLNKALVYDHPLCSEVSSFNWTSEAAGAFVVIATARPGEKLAVIEGVIAKEIARLAAEGPTVAELNRAKTKQEYNFVSGLERIGGFGGKADVLNQYNTFLGDPGMLAQDVQRYRDVTAADLQRAVAAYLDRPGKVILRFHPEASTRPPASTLDRAAEPPLGTDRPFHAPEVKTAKLANGIDLFVVERPELPKVAVTVATRAGGVADPKGRAGLAELTLRTIDKGTKTRKALAIEDALGDLGATLGGSPGRLSSALSLEVLKRNLGAAVAIVADVVQNPTFPADEVDREQKVHLDGLLQADKNANAVAGRVRAILAFGPDHPYGRPVAGLPSSVKAITRDDIVKFHATHWKPGGSAVVMVGDVTLAEAKALVEKEFGAWTGAAPSAVSVPAPSAAAPGKIYLVDRQDAAQTVVSQWVAAPMRKSPDYYALRLADAVWGGGGFGTRLNLNLREDKGYSYGVFSGLALYDHSGLWYAGGGVQTNKTKESIVEFDQELKDLAGAKPLSESEFDDAKLKRIRGYAQAFESLGRIADQIGALWALDLPMAELQRESDETAKVTLEESRAAAARYAIPAKSTLLLVGDRSKIEAGVRELNLGEIVLLDTEGRPAN